MGEGVGQFQPDLSFDDLYKQAESSMPVLQNTAQDLLDRLKAENPKLFEGVIFQIAKIKDRNDSLQKIDTDYEGDPRRLKDMVRGRFVVETSEQILAIKQALTDHLKIDGMNDKYKKPSSSTGYRDINTKIALENGHIAEIQVQQRDMLLVSTPTHLLRAETEKIEEQARIENRALTEAEKIQIDALEKEATSLHNAAAHDAGINDLLDEEHREKFTYTGEFDSKGSALGKIAETLGGLGKNGGFIAGAVLGTLSGAFTLAAGGSTAEAAEAVYESAMLYGETQIDVVRGDTEAAKRSATIETASNSGAVGGMLLGASLGTMIAPGPGTAVGAVVGGVVGGIASGEATELIYDHAEDIADWWDGSDDELLERLPTQIAENAPPELQHLVEIKRILVEAQQEREALGNGRTRNKDVLSARREAMDKIEHAENLYDQAYDTYEDNGSIQTAVAHLTAHEKTMVAQTQEQSQEVAADTTPTRLSLSALTS